MSASFEKIREFRQIMKTHGVDAYIIPNNDEFQNEYLPDSAKRLEFLTGFTGSAGLAIITPSKAAFFTDGRYTLQAKDQLDTKVFEIHNISTKRPEQWVAENNIKCGFDAWTMSLAQVRRFDAKNLQPITHSPNLVDLMWKSKPQVSPKILRVHEEHFAGESSQSKRKRIGQELKADAALLTSPDSVNWLLNIRGSDVAHTPLCLCYAALSKDGTVDLFIDKKKINQEALSHLGKDVKIHDLATVTKIGPNQHILIDPARIPYALYQSMKSNGAEITEGQDPCQLPKAIKNETEISGIKRAHKIDGAALTKFLNWLPQQNQLDELKASEQLESFRRENPEYLEPSFDTISGFGANGAIVHYRSTPESNKQFSLNNLYLVDSGGQYEFGTTDVTRTVVIGEPIAEMKRDYTNVLKGHIALASAIFPRGTTGAQLDSLARQFLWADGKDYDHGTGHGVGYYLSVHEGPQGISKRYNDTALQPGMVISNEPGYYKTGEYGIRIENLVLVVEKPNGYLGFETLTKAPFDDKLIEVSMLTEAEQSWIKNYYASL